VVVKLHNQRVKMRVLDIRYGADPGADQALLIQDETEFATYNPPMIALPFLANLGRATPFPDGVTRSYRCPPLPARVEGARHAGQDVFVAGRRGQ
jgi:hypothetical protein